MPEGLNREGSLFSFDASRPLVPEKHRHRKRAIALGIALGITVVGLGLALLLGHLGYDIRREAMHNARLEGILVQTPTVYQVTEGLKEKAPLAAIVASPGDLDEAVHRWGRDKAEEIRDKATSWPQLRVYAAGDMMYFIYFDDRDIMRDYVFVSA
jgi:hypothetical protein